MGIRFMDRSLKWRWLIIAEAEESEMPLKTMSASNAGRKGIGHETAKTV
jgi:hypothetical protein